MLFSTIFHFKFHLTELIKGFKNIFNTYSMTIFVDIYEKSDNIVIEKLMKRVVSRSVKFDSDDYVILMGYVIEYSSHRINNIHFRGDVKIMGFIIF